MAQQPGKKQEQPSIFSPWKRRSILLVFVPLLIIGVSIWKLADLTIFPNYMSTIIKTFIAIIAGVYTVIIAIVPIIDKFYPVKSLFPSSAEPLPQKYNVIIGTPPSTNAMPISQRAEEVNDLYQSLSQTDMNALVLTGIDGVGKSTLAALVYHHIEKQLLSHHKSPFTAKPLWLKIYSNVTMIDLAGTLFREMGSPMPDFSKLSPLQQARELFNLLNTPGKSRLVVLDQFDRLLHGQTGQVLNKRPGIEEWLEMLNNQPLDKLACRLLFTSRLRPQIVSPTNKGLIKEHKVANLNENEGIALLHELGVQGEDDDDTLRSIVKRCGGHALALKYLADIITEFHVKPSNFFNNPIHDQLLQKDIARDLLDYIYNKILTPRQKKLLLAFSLYREAMPLEAGLVVMNDHSISFKEVSEDLDVLHKQQLLSASDDLYQLQAIVARYAQDHFDAKNTQSNQKLLKLAHASAAQYYMQQIISGHTTRGQSSSLTHLLTEAVWQLCQSEQWQEAYKLMEQNGLFDDFKGRRENIAFLEAYELLLDSSKWQPEPLGKAHLLYNLGMIVTDLGKKEQAKCYYTEALSIWKDKGERKWEGVTLSNLGRVYSALGMKKEALQRYNDALSILKETGEKVWIGTTLSYLGRAFGSLGQLEDAKQSYESALNILKDENDRSIEGITWSYLGVIYCNLGEKEKCLSCCQRGLSIVEKAEDLRGVGRALKNLGYISYILAQYETAQTYYEKALSASREARDLSGEGVVLQNLGDIYSAIGDVKEAQNFYRQALEVLEEVGDHWRESKVLNDLGLIYTASQQWEEAKKAYKKALTVRRTIEDRRGESSTLCNIGKLFVLLKSYDTALAYFLLSKKILIEIGSPSHKEVEEQLAELRTKLSEEQFTTTEAQADFIVEHALEETI